MKRFIRILICVFSIIILRVSILFAGESEVIPVVSENATSITIPHAFVKIELVHKILTSASALQAAQSLTQLVQDQYYSLLSWKNENRPKDIEVESYGRVHHFGRWVSDTKDPGCYNTRAKVLIRDSIKPVIFEASNPCSVESGEWHDPYAHKVLTNAKSQVQIDHMVPLKNAYVSGAYKWNFNSRCLYGNYLGAQFHLISVDGTENVRKGSDGPDGYMPPNKEYRCTYLKNWLTIKSLWNLEMTLTEAQAIKDLIQSEGCSLSSFRISAEELNSQRKFANENAALCANINPTFVKNKN